MSQKPEDKKPDGFIKRILGKGKDKKDPKDAKSDVTVDDAKFDAILAIGRHLFLKEEFKRDIAEMGEEAARKKWYPDDQKKGNPPSR